MIKLGDRLRGRTLAATVELKSPNRPTAQRGGAATLLFAWFVVPEKIKAADRAKQVNEFHWVKADSHVEKQHADARFESQRTFGVSRLWVVENDVRTPLLDRREAPRESSPRERGNHSGWDALDPCTGSPDRHSASTHPSRDRD